MAATPRHHTTTPARARLPPIRRINPASEKPAKERTTGGGSAAARKKKGVKESNPPATAASQLVSQRRQASALPAGRRKIVEPLANQNAHSQSGVAYGGGADKEKDEEEEDLDSSQASQESRVRPFLSNDLL